MPFPQSYFAAQKKVLGILMEANLLLGSCSFCLTGRQFFFLKVSMSSRISVRPRRLVLSPPKKTSCISSSFFSGQCFFRAFSRPFSCAQLRHSAQTYTASGAIERTQKTPVKRTL
jgi:hypothetical protein